MAFPQQGSKKFADELVVTVLNSRGMVSHVGSSYHCQPVCCCIFKSFKMSTHAAI